MPLATTSSPCETANLARGTGLPYSAREYTPVIGLIQSTFATDLEIIVENQNGDYQHWWLDGSGWHPGPITLWHV